MLPPPPGASAGRSVVQTDSFASAALGITKRYVVYLPPSYAAQPARRYPVVYLLHGSGGTERDWVDAINVNQVLDSLAAAGAPEVIAIMPDGDNWFYHDWVGVPPACSGQPYTGEMPSEPCVPGLKYNYGTYIARDVVARVDATYRTRADAAHRGIGGMSMGGFGAAYLSLARPDVFSAAVVMGGGRLNFLTLDGAGRKATSTAELQPLFGNGFGRFIAEYGSDFANWRANEPVTMVALSRQAGRQIPALWITVGQSDVLRPGSEELSAALTQAGAAHTFREPPGDHSNTFWRSQEGDALAWLLQRFGS